MSSTGFKAIGRVGRSAGLGVLCALALLASAASTGEDYAWPLDLKPVLTSSFAEQRPGRFHAGIDLHTDGVGREVHAALDGYVSRVRCSPWGYGKAIYLRLADGNTAVYAHLQSFAAPLDAYVYGKQHRAKNYTVDLYPPKGKFPVKRGQVIALSGQTGIGYPHLHYELRDAAQRPINPRVLGATWRDVSKPQVHAVLAVPRGPDSRINGDMMPVVLTPKRAGKGLYTCKPITARGQIGLGLAVTDLSNKNQNRLGVHHVRTYADETLVFETVNDRLSYDNIRDGAVSFHPFLTDKSPFLLQWRWDGNRCEPFNKFRTEGWHTVSPTNRELKLEAEDFAGNTVSVSVPIAQAFVGQEEPAVPSAESSCGIGTVTLDCFGTWLVLTATFPDVETAAPVLWYTGPTPSEGGKFVQVAPKVFRAGYAPAPGADRVTFTVQHRLLKPYTEVVEVFHRGRRARSASLNGLNFEVADDSPYGTMFLKASETPLPQPSELPVRGKVYEVWPPLTPIGRPIGISFPCPKGEEDLDKLHVYRHTDKGWIQQKTDVADGRLSISTRDLGVFAVMEDRLAPTLWDIEPATEEMLSSKRPVIQAGVEDLGCTSLAIEVTCDGQWLLMEYDPERKRIEWARDHDLPSGRHTLTFEVTDASGNTITRTRLIETP